MKRERRSVLLVAVVGLCGPMLFAAAAHGHEEFLPPMPSPARPPGPTLATVNGAPVTLRDYEDAAKSLPRDRRSAEQILRKAIQYELLHQEGIRLGFDKDPALIRQLDELRGEYTKDRLTQREAERLGSIPDAELRRHYEARDTEPAATRRAFDEVKGRVREEYIRHGLQRRFEELYAEAEKQGLVWRNEEAAKNLMVPPPDNPEPDVVLATVNGTAITVHAFGHAFSSLDRAAREAVRKDPTPLIQGLIEEEIRRQEGLRLGLDREPAFAQYLDRRTREYVVLAVTRSARAPAVTEDAMRHYYEAHTDEFTTHEEVVASHILLKSRDAAEAVLAELTAGADFAALARARSADAATRADGGRLSTIRRGRMTAQFEQAVFALQRGETSGVVKDAAGFHVIRVHQRSPAALQPFDAVKGWLHRKLTLEAQQIAIAQHVAELESEAMITMDQAAVAKLGGAGR